MFSLFIIRVHPEFDKNIIVAKAKISALDNLIEVLKNKQIWLNGFYCFTIYGTTVLFADLWGIRYLSLKGFNQETAGLCTSLIFIGVAIFSPVWGAIASILNSEQKPLFIAPIIGFFIVIFLLYINTNEYIAFLLCVLFGGSQAVHVLNYSALRNTVPVVRIATALALVNLFLPLSGGILQPVTGAIIGQLSKNHSNLFAFEAAMIFVPILMILSFIIALFIKNSKG
ncbi:MAG: MFS family permease [Francisella sp.]